MKSTCQIDNQDVLTSSLAFPASNKSFDSAVHTLVSDGNGAKQWPVPLRFMVLLSEKYLIRRKMEIGKINYAFALIKSLNRTSQFAYFSIDCSERGRR